MSSLECIYKESALVVLVNILTFVIEIFFLNSFNPLMQTVFFTQLASDYFADGGYETNLLSDKTKKQKLLPHACLFYYKISISQSSLEKINFDIQVLQ